MASNYPAGLDSFPTVGPATPMDDPGAEHDVLHNGMADAIEAMQAELGLTPSGAYDTVAARLDAIGTGGGGSANIAYPDAPASPVEGDFWLDPDALEDTSSFSDLGNAGTTKTINCTTAAVQQITLNQSSVTFTFSGAPAAGYVRRWRLHTKHDATSSARAIVWPAALKWVGGTTPTTLTTSNGAVAIFDFTTLADGTTYGQHVGNFT